MTILGLSFNRDGDPTASSSFGDSPQSLRRRRWHGWITHPAVQIEMAELPGGGPSDSASPFLRQGMKFEANTPLFKSEEHDDGDDEAATGP